MILPGITPLLRRNSTSSIVVGVLRIVLASLFSLPSSISQFTDHVFALTALLGFRFAPRIADALSRKLYLLDEMEDYGTLKTLLFGKVNRKLIVEQWDEMRRVASSIRHGTVSASLLMRKLAAYPRQNQVARALTELGKLERTAFLLEYFRDESLRRRILIGRE